jgi:hypothetical protein
MTTEVGTAVTLHTRSQEVLGSKLSRDTWYPDRQFAVSSQNGTQEILLESRDNSVGIATG